MGQALYRKYRSRSLAEIVGQEHITTALDNAIKKGQVSHAYLFTGPRGVGKTSIARILAYELNGLPYDESATHLDIIEIDAASNRRIDEIRELRERVHSAPAGAKYKVYIIDEVHMLTREAFNALLKTLEEPPAHAIFILATTEAHKLPETIVSRTQRYTFRPIESPKVVGHLRAIAAQEEIDIDDEALQLIAEHGDGSFRDSISLLDQIRNTADKITLEVVQQSLGIAPEQAISRLIETLESADPQAVLDELKSMQLQGYHAAQIAKQLSERLRTRLVNGTGALPAGAVSRLLRELLQVPASQDSLKLLEITLLEATLREDSDNREYVAAETKTARPAAPEKAARAENIAGNRPEDQKKDTETPRKPAKMTKSDQNAQPLTPNRLQGEGLNEESWQAVLHAIKARHNTLYSVTRMAVPTFKDGELVLAFSFPFHQKRLKEAKNRQIISDVILQTTGQNVSITCIVDINARTKPAAAVAPAVNESVETISNIFGGGEMLE